MTVRDGGVGWLVGMLEVSIRSGRGEAWEVEGGGRSVGRVVLDSEIQWPNVI